MAVYTVHEPPLKAYESAPDPHRFAFVRDGFSFWAFLFGPLWMLRHRLWLVLIGYLVTVVALLVGLRMLGVSGRAMFVVMVLVALLVGFEAATLRRFTYGRRRWKHAGIIVGDDREVAEQRFFDAWVRRQATATPSAPPGVPVPRRAPASDVIGLFPEPRAPQ